MVLIVSGVSGGRSVGSIAYVHMTKKEHIKSFLETLLSSSRTVWEAHENPTKYTWELAILAYSQGHINRAHLRHIAIELNIGRRQRQHDFDRAYEYKVLCEKKKVGR